MDFYRQILNNQHKLNENETVILSELMRLAMQLKTKSLQELAASFYIAPNTIVRMCKKLGFEGYTDFKSIYMFSLEHQDFKPITLSLDERLERTRRLLNQEMVTQVISLLFHANRIVIFATGLSKLVGDEFAERLKTVGKSVETFIYPHLMRHQAKSLSDNDVCFTISLSGETQSILDATEIAKLLKARVISLTGVSKNRLSELSDFQLYAYSNDIFIESIDVADRLAFSYVINVLFESYLETFNKQV